MESIIRNAGQEEINLADFYSNIREGKGCPEFSRKTNILVGEKEYLILEALGKGRMGFVFLAYHQRKLTALKMSYEDQEKEDIFSTVKKTIGDEYRNYFLNPVDKTIKINSFYLGGVKEENKNLFDRDIFITFWEAADAILSEKLDDSFENKLKWFRQFLKGLIIIHARNRAHFDIKLENLFLVGDHLKIGDFEFYAKTEDFKKSGILCGTPGHIAPEMFYGRERITSKIDIFSAGIAFARLFIGKRFEGKLELTSQEETEMQEWFKNPNAGQFFNDTDFQINYKIFHFYKSKMNNLLEAHQLHGGEKAVYKLLLKMIDIDPGIRPAVDEILKEINTISAGSGLILKDKQKQGEEKESSETYKTDSFLRLLQSHKYPEIIKYSLVFKLMKKLKQDNIRGKIGHIHFEGDGYKIEYFSFDLLTGERFLNLFGKKICGSDRKYDKIWNVLVVIDYWNRYFELGLEDEVDRKHIDGIFDDSDKNKDWYDNEINETKKWIKKVMGKL